MDKNSLVCLICCKEFQGGCDGVELGRKEENLQSLQQFCEVILEVDKNELDGKDGLFTFFNGTSKTVKFKGNKGDRTGSKESMMSKFGGDLEEEHVDRLNDKLSEFLRNPSDNLSICGDCFDLMKMVTEARVSAKCVEETVEKLQMLLLRELRRLQGRLELFWREFEKMEETLANGNIKLIGSNLDGSYSLINNGGKRLSRNLGKKSEEHLEREKEIFGFREKISQVFRDFHKFNKKLTDKIACVPNSQPTSSSTTAASKKMVEAQRQSERKRKSIQKSTDKQPRKDSVKGLSSPLLLEYKLKKIGRVRDNEEDIDNDVNMDDEPMHIDNFDDNDDNYNDDSQVETQPVGKRASLRRHATRKKYDLASSDSGEDDSGKEEREEYQPEVSTTSKQVETKPEDKRRRGRPRKQDKRKSANLEKDNQKQNWSEDDDEDYNPEDPETLSTKAKVNRLLQEYEPHLAQMSPFKRNVISNVIKCQFYNENREKKNGADKLNVFQRHMIHLSYNLESQLINLKDVPIKIVCQSETENEENGLLCTKCDFKIAECHKIGNLMWEHVLSKHLNAYHCPHCPDKQLENYSQYSLHVSKCFRKREQVDKVECDICGKSLCNSRALEYHKWSHMNELERKEALESGLVKKDPLLKSIKEKKFQCETCGKSFGAKSYLEKHEVTHQDRDSREQFICAKCGKSFLKTGYEYHLKYGGSCWEDDNPNRKKETCGICGKIMLNKVILKRHLREMHTEVDVRPWKCEICGKAFKKKMTLKLHGRMHTGEKPWKCGKCGTAFTRRNNMKRHEANCGN